MKNKLKNKIINKNIILSLIIITLIIVITLFNVNIINAQDSISLYSLNISNITLYFNQSNIIYVRTYNIDNNLTDVNDIKINLLDKINYTSSKVIRENIGTYYQSFIINNINNTNNFNNITFEIKATDKEKVLIRQINLEIKEPNNYIDFSSLTNNFDNLISDSVDNIQIWIQNNFIMFLIFTIIFIFIDITIIVYMIIRKRDRR